jgi:hypothetical protein
MGAYVDPKGTVAVILVVVAAVTVARVAPNKTMLLEVLVLKPVPVKVIISPGLADVGLKALMTGLTLDCEKHF